MPTAPEPSMPDILDFTLGKVFMHPVTKEEYGPIRRSSRNHFSNLRGTSLEALAEDSCGNYFTITEDGAVCFWDHETDDLVRLASSVSEFATHCIERPPVELNPSQVKSAWINPAFAKSLGMKVPKDGWVKKPSKRK
jgi:hypothetical protein